MSIFHRTGTVLEFRAGALGEEGSDARRVRALRGSPPRGSPQRSHGGAHLPVRAPAPGGVGRCATGTAGTACAPPPPGGSRSTATATSPSASASPEPRPPGGVELMMSPRLALCEAGWRESSRGGFRRAGLARCEAGWTASRWARIAQARPGPGPVIPLSGPGITQARPGPDPVQELVSAEDEHPGPGPPRPDLRRLGAGRADPGVGGVFRVVGSSPSSSSPPPSSRGFSRTRLGTALLRDLVDAPVRVLAPMPVCSFASASRTGTRSARGPRPARVGLAGRAEGRVRPRLRTPAGEPPGRSRRAGRTPPLPSPATPRRGRRGRNDSRASSRLDPAAPEHRPGREHVT